MNVQPIFILVLVTLFGLPSAVGGQELSSLQESCNAGDPLACYEIGAMFRTGNSVQRDPMRATVYLERACNEGAMPACAALGTMYQRGEGVDQDTRRALGLLEQSCDGDVFYACTSLGVLYLDGSRVPQDFERAREYVDGACTGGDALGCANLGVLYQRGYGVEENDIRARELFSIACRGGIAQACRLATEGPWELVRYEPDEPSPEASVRMRTRAGARATLRISCTPERTEVNVEWGDDFQNQEVELRTHAGSETTATEDWEFDAEETTHRYVADGRDLVVALSGVETESFVASTLERSASFVIDGLSVLSGPLATVCSW